MYAVIQFAEKDGGTLAVVNTDWLTPRKCEVHWPPVKDTKAFERLLESAPDKNWKLYNIQKIFYETESIENAKQKLKLAEVTSDLATEDESVVNDRPKRKAIRNHRYISSDEELSDDDRQPPPLKKQFIDIVQKQPVALGSPSPKNLQQLLSEPENKKVSAESSSSGNSSTDNKTCSCLLDTALDITSIKTQNIEIIQLLQDIKAKLWQNTTGTAVLNPHKYLPMKTIIDVSDLELKLSEEDFYTSLVDYLRSIGGKNCSEKTYRVMKLVITDALATNYSYYGKRSNKIPFASLTLKSAILESLKDNMNTEKEIEDNIKSWLKHAPDREKAKLKRLAQH